MKCTLDRPVLIVGTPRSGKTLVSRVLGDTGEFGYVDEPLSTWDLGLGSRADDCRGADEADAVAEQIAACCRAAIEGSQAPRYLDNLAYHALRIPFIARALPGARLIHVARRPEDTIPEMIYGWTAKDTVSAAVARRTRHIQLRTFPRLALRFVRNYFASRATGRRASWGPRVPGLEDFADNHPVALVAAFQWERMVNIALDDLQRLSGDQWIHVRFERLFEGQAELKRIAEFAEVSDPAGFLAAAAKRIDPHFDHRYRVVPTAREWETIDELVEPTRRRLEELPWTGPRLDSQAPPPERPRRSE